MEKYNSISLKHAKKIFEILSEENLTKENGGARLITLALCTCPNGTAKEEELFERVNQIMAMGTRLMQLIYISKLEDDPMWMGKLIPLLDPRIDVCAFLNKS